MLAELLQGRAGSTGLIANAVRNGPGVLRIDSRPEGRVLFRRGLRIELPECSGIDRISKLEHLTSGIGVPAASQVHVAVSHTRGRPTRRQSMNFVKATDQILWCLNRPRAIAAVLCRGADAEIGRAH